MSTMRDYRFVVFTNAVPGREVEFERWYDEVHIGDILAIAGFTGSERCKAAQGQAVTHQFCTIYSIRTDNVAAVMSELVERAKTGKMLLSDAMAPDPLAYIYEVTAPVATQTGSIEQDASDPPKMPCG